MFLLMFNKMSFVHFLSNANILFQYITILRKVVHRRIFAGNYLRD